MARSPYRQRSHSISLSSSRLQLGPAAAMKVQPARSTPTILQVARTSPGGSDLPPRRCFRVVCRFAVSSQPTWRLFVFSRRCGAARPAPSDVYTGASFRFPGQRWLAGCSLWWSGLSPALWSTSGHARLANASKPIKHIKACLLPSARVTVLTLRGKCISLDLIELFTISSGDDFMQVPIDLLKPGLGARASLARTMKTDTAETAARNFVSLVLRDVMLPNVLV